MSKSSAPQATPKPNVGEVKPKTNTADANQRSIFISAMLDMSWQLAVVVLVPIIGGFELDKHFKTSPLLLIIGFVVAMGGVFVVLKRMLAELNQHFLAGGKR